MNINDYFTKGLKKTLRFRNNSNLSYSGRWTQLFNNTIVDEFFVGDFIAAEYTICVDAGSIEREIVKCLVIAGVEAANITVYGRVNLGNSLINLSAEVNAAKVSLIASPIGNEGKKFYYSANYFNSVEQLGDIV
jgi:hypothetical protein